MIKSQTKQIADPSKNAERFPSDSKVVTQRARAHFPLAEVSEPVESIQVTSDRLSVRFPETLKKLGE